MPAKRFPIFILIVISVLATWYNFDSLLQLREGKVKLSLPLVAVDEPEPDAVAELTKSPIEPLTALPAPSPPILNPSPVNDTRANPQGPDPALLASDVLLIIKTGASTFWRRMPLHLTTTLSNGRIPNAVIYSDLQEQLSSSIEAVDALANVSDILQKHDPPAYASYLEQQSPDHVNTYREHGRLPGDEPPHEKAGNTPGWLLDKYKFLPMLAHAQKNWPGLKWYIYIEDDTFIFLHNLLQWLSTLPTDDEPCYYGAYSGGGNDTFAQGGSGIVFSRSLMRSVFGGDKTADLEGYGNYTSKACCGDIALGKVLRDYDIYVNRGDYGPVAFRPEPPWKTGFDELIWCSPVFTFHHLHQRDLVQLARLEETQRSSNPSVSLYFSPETQGRKILTFATSAQPSSVTFSPLLFYHTSPIQSGLTGTTLLRNLSSRLTPRLRFPPNTVLPMVRLSKRRSTHRQLAGPRALHLKDASPGDTRVRLRSVDWI
jgi:hypothetical protein